MFTLGIDASNIKMGGGITHIVNLINNMSLKYPYEKLILWCNKDVADLIHDKKCIEKKVLPVFSGNILSRFIWQIFNLPIAVRKNKVSILFNLDGKFIPFTNYVTISQNMLPFQLKEAARYGLSFTFIRLLILRIIYEIAFKNANGMIFLTNFSRDYIENVIGKLNCHKKIIPHGISNNFFRSPIREPIKSKNLQNKKNINLIYVSIIDVYKHQWEVVLAVNNLRKRGYKLTLKLVGPAYLPSLKKLKSQIIKIDKGSWLEITNQISYEKLPNLYHQSDIGIFASTCENLPNILIEMMASGLPIICSDRGPMTEILGKTGIYFDPENVDDIEKSLEKLIISKSLCSKLAMANYKNAKSYSWAKCSMETFSFLKQVSNSFPVT